MPKAYPVYNEHYQGRVETMRGWIAQSRPKVTPVGRNGMHRYNSQDHSMHTAMLSVEGIFAADHGVWSGNVEAQYHQATATPRANVLDARPQSAKGTGRDAPILSRDAIEAAAAARRGDGAA